MKGFTRLLGNFFGVGFRLTTYLNILYLTLAFPLGVLYFVLLVTGLSTGITTSFLLVGLVILALTLTIAWWLAEFERQQAIWLLRLPVGPMGRNPEAPGVGNWLKAYLGNPVTWTGLLFLFLKFPLGIFAFSITTTVLAFSVGLLSAPFIYTWVPMNFFVWRIDTLPEALALFAGGLISLWLSLHLLNGLAAVMGQLARLLLGGAARPVDPVPETAPAKTVSAKSCLLPAAAIVLFACMACLLCSAIAAAPFLARNNEGHDYERATFTPTTENATATAQATLTAVAPTVTPLRPTFTETSPATATPTASATVAATLTPTPAPTDTPTPIPASPTPAATDTPAATATDTPTAAPTFTPTPAGPDPLANAGPVLFEENFAPARYYWGTGDNANSQVQIKDGGLALTIKTAKRIHWSFSGAPAKADFYLSGVVTPTTCAEGDHFGLVFRAQEESNLLLFGITCDGRYQLTQYANGTARSLVALTPSGALQPQAANQLGVRAVGKQLDLYANGQFLATVEVDTAKRGLFGVYANAAATPGLSVVFGDLKAWEIKP